MENKPKTKKECFAQLDEMLSETDKKAIVEAEDLFEFHFTLGLLRPHHLGYCRHGCRLPPAADAERGQDISFSAHGMDDGDLRHFRPPLVTFNGIIAL